MTYENDRVQVHPAGSRPALDAVRLSQHVSDITDVKPAFGNAPVAKLSREFASTEALLHGWKAEARAKPSKPEQPKKPEIPKQPEAPVPAKPEAPVPVKPEEAPLSKEEKLARENFFKLELTKLSTQDLRRPGIDILAETPEDAAEARRIVAEWQKENPYSQAQIKVQEVGSEYSRERDLVSSGDEEFSRWNGTKRCMFPTEKEARQIFRSYGTFGSSMPL